MTTSISAYIFALKGQKINKIYQNKVSQELIIDCSRDRRYKALDPITGHKGTINQYVTREVRDLPLLGQPCIIKIELAQVYTQKNYRKIENCSFVDKGSRFTKRFCQMVSGLCRYMSIQTVSRHLKLRWETTKKMDKAYLEQSLPDLDPSKLKGLKYIGVDEVARAKGHDYMTVVYDMVEGHLIWVETGRTAEVFSTFLKQLPKETAHAIEAVAMDMGLAYQKATRENLPNADIVFDRFHVMQNYSKAVSNQRRVEFRKATKSGKDIMKGTHYLLLKNAEKLNDKQALKLETVLDNNHNLNTLYVLKEQLQAFWNASSYEQMQKQLMYWYELAKQTNMTYLRKFADSLLRHCSGICNYAKHKLTSARVEAGNIAIGMIRKRARGIKDTEYFKLKIRQSSLPDKESFFYDLA